MGIGRIFRIVRNVLLGTVIAAAAKGVQHLAKTSVRQEKTVVTAVKETPPPDSLRWLLPVDRLHRPNQLLFRKSYTVSYNRETKCPNWVCWELTREHADGSIKRPDYAFHEDGEVPRPRALPEDYRGSGYDRGHLCPAGDNKWDAEAMYESFLMTNICPQDKDMNAGMWNRMEMRCRYWAKKYGCLYIVTGPLFLSEQPKMIGKNRVAVPDAFFKAILCLEDRPKGIAFVCRNNGCTSREDWFFCSIADVERLAGYTFFPALGKEVSGAVKMMSDPKEW